MPADTETLDTVRSVTQSGYKWGFETDIEMDVAPKGLSADTIRLISERKQEPSWMLEWRLKAYEAWLQMEEPHWARVEHPRIDYQDIHYYAAPKKKDGPKSLDEVDPELLRTYEKLGIPLKERAILAGVVGADGDGYVEGSGQIAVDAVFDSVSVATTFRATLAKSGVIFCPISEAIRDYPDLVRQYIGSVVPTGDNFFAALNSRCVHRWQLRLHSEGRALPDGIVDVFPHQHAQHRPVRTHADHRRGRRARVLPGRLHGAATR